MESMVLLKTLKTPHGEVMIEQHMTPEALLGALYGHLSAGRWVQVVTHQGEPVTLRKGREPVLTTQAR